MLRWWSVGALLVTAALIGGFVGDGPLRFLRAGPQSLADPLRDLGPLAWVASLLLNVLTVVVPTPGTPVALANGAVFGLWTATLLNLAGGLCGAALCFWIGRSLAADRLARMLTRRPERWAHLHGRPGGGTVATARVAGASYGLVSYVCGATAMGWWPFLWGTAVGTLPRAAAYAVLGSAFEIPLWATLVVGPAVAVSWLMTQVLRRRRSLAAVVDIESAARH